MLVSKKSGENTTMKIQVSIIVPVYNCEKYIETLLKDIAKQSFDQYEVILIDDGSTDKSGEICDHFCAKNSKFKVYHLKNGGVSQARNKGILKAKGQYIRFLDADDRIPSDSLERMIKCAEASKAELVIGKFFSERKVWQSELTGIQDKQRLFLDFSKYAFSFYYGVVWNKLYKTECIMKHKIQFDRELNMCEDALFNFEYFQYVNKVYYITEEVYSYFNHENSLVTKVTHSENEIIEQKCIKTLYNFIKQEENIKDPSIKHNLMGYLAYRYHMVYCRICDSGVSGYFKEIKKEYRAYKQYLKKINAKQFWKEFDNSDRFMVYGIIKALHTVKCDAVVFLFVRTKEYIRKHNKEFVTMFQKIIKNPTMKI